MSEVESAFIRFVRTNRLDRQWSIAELARRAALTQPEVSRLESGVRLPTLRHVKGLSEAFFAAPVSTEGQPQRYADWVTLLVDLGERSRIAARCGPGRWSKRTKTKTEPQPQSS